MPYSHESAHIIYCFENQIYYYFFSSIRPAHEIMVLIA